MTKLEYDKGYQERLETQKKENEVIHKGVLEYKSDMHQRQTDFKEQSMIAKQKRNPFNAKINEQSLANATKVKERRAAQEGGYGMTRDEGFDMSGGHGMLDDDRFGGEAGGDIDAKLNAE